MVGVSPNLVVPLATAATPTRLPQVTQPRIVESSARGSLETENRRPAYDSSKAVLELVQHSAQQFKQILREAEKPAEQSTAEAAATNPETGEHVDVMA